MPGKKGINTLGDKLFLGLCLGVILLCLISLENYTIHLLKEYMVHYMIVFLLLGVIFLAYNKHVLLYSSLLCAGVLALYLKSNTDPPIKLVKEESLVSFNLAEIDLDRMRNDTTEWVQKISARNPDILVFYNVETDWYDLLYNSLKERYRITKKLERLDMNGAMVFSRYEMEQEALINSTEIPTYSLVTTLPFEDMKLRLLVSNLVGINNMIDYDIYTHQLSTISDFVTTSPELPLLLSGRISCSSWDKSLREFRKELGLKETRRNYVVAKISKIGLVYLDIEESNIYYDNQLECSYSNNVNFTRNTIGLMGGYQLKK